MVHLSRGGDRFCQYVLGLRCWGGRGNTLQAVGPRGSSSEGQAGAGAEKPVLDTVS